MTVQDLLVWIDAHPGPVLVLLILPPLLTVLLGRLHKPGEGGTGTLRWAYAALIYTVCVPGIGATLVTLYAVLFTGQNLLTMGLVSTLLPIVSMAATLIKMAQQVDFEQIPGFDRLAGLITLLGLTFAILLFLQRMRIWIVFHAPLTALVAVGVAVFGLLRWAAYAVGRRSDQPVRDMPGPDELS